MTTDDSKWWQYCRAKIVRRNRRTESRPRPKRRRRLEPNALAVVQSTLSKREKIGQPRFRYASSAKVLLGECRETRFPEGVPDRCIQLAVGTFEPRPVIIVRLALLRSGCSRNLRIPTRLKRCASLSMSLGQACPHLSLEGRLIFLLMPF
jgi:hypothetical protein